jgi:AcrR family transcriptional regulator
LKKVTSPPENVEFYDTYKYFKESVLIDDDIKNEIIEHQEDHLSPNDTTASPNSKLRQILSQAGLSGTGLDKLCARASPLELKHVRAVILYAEARGLGPGYIYRHLESEATVDAPFRQLAGLDDETLNLFRQGVSELKANGTMFLPAIVTPIPQHLAHLFARFAEIFAGIKAEAALAALLNDPGQEIKKDHLTDQGRAELDLLWSQILAQLQLQMSQGTFDTWLKETRLLARDGLRLTVAVKNGFAKEWLENRLYKTIRRVVKNLLEAEELLKNLDVELEFVVDGTS